MSSPVFSWWWSHFLIVRPIWGHGVSRCALLSPHVSALCWVVSCLSCAPLFSYVGVEFQRQHTIIELKHLTLLYGLKPSFCIKKAIGKHLYLSHVVIISVPVAVRLQSSWCHKPHPHTPLGTLQHQYTATTDGSEAPADGKGGCVPNLFLLSTN